MIPKNILVIKLGALGDFIQSLGAMRSIRETHSNDRITLLTTKSFESIAIKSGYFDDVLIDSRPKIYQLSKFWLHIKKLNAKKLWRVYDLQNNDRTSFYFHFLSPKPEWVGTARGASHQNTSKERTKGKSFYGHVQTLGLAGIKYVSIDTLDWMKSERSFSSVTKPYVLIVSGCSQKHPEKKWPEQHYISLCKMLLNHKMVPVLIGAEGDTQTTQKIKMGVPACVDLTGKTNIFDIPSLAKDAFGAIGNDTGPMHLIGPTRCPTLVLFGNKTNPEKHAPLGDFVHTLQKKRIKDISPDEVLDVFLSQTAS